MKLASSVCALGASFVLLACSIETHPTLTSDAGVDAGSHHASGGRSSRGSGGASSGGTATGAGGSGGIVGRLLDGSLPDRMMGFGGRIRDGGLLDASQGGSSMDAGSPGSGGTQGTGGHGGTTGTGGHAGSGTGGHAGTGAGGHAGQGTGGAPAMCGNILCDCTLKGIKLWGNVAIDPDFPDFVINIDDSFPDLYVEMTEFPDSCGQWNMVTDFADFTVNIDPNEAFPDFTISYSDFPGVANK